MNSGDLSVVFDDAPSVRSLKDRIVSDAAAARLDGVVAQMQAEEEAARLAALDAALAEPADEAAAEAPDAGPIESPAWVIRDGQAEQVSVKFVEVRFRVALTCPCGAAVHVHPEHEQHRCACGLIYRLDGLGIGMVQYLRTARGRALEQAAKAADAARRRKLAQQARKAGGRRK